MAGILKVDRIQSDSNLSFAVAGANVAYMNASGMVYGNTTIGTSIITTAGITFPATQVPSADGNTLDDYEEGTWTPALAVSVSGSITMSTQEGVYTKIGRTVFFSCRFSTASISSPTGTITVTGLPFASGSQTRFACTIADMRSWGTAFTTPITATVEQSTTAITLTKQATNTGFSGVAGSDVSASSSSNNMQIAGFYVI
jgi:hypothetical protein